MNNVWSLAIVIVLAVTVFVIALLVVRVDDGRRAAAANAKLQEQAGRDALVVLNANTQLELAKYEYAGKQAQFAREVLDLYSKGMFKIAEPELVAAIARQLDGVAPPKSAPTMAIRNPPRAEWPNFEATYQEHTL